jgi:hypothetical protein
MEVSSSALVSSLRLDLLESVPSGFLSARDYFPGASVREVFAIRLWNSVVKKLKDDVAPNAEGRCLEKFLAANDRCRAWQFDASLSRDDELFGTLKEVLDEFFHPGGLPMFSSYFDILSRGRCGPGSSLGANGTDFYTKLFSSKLTCTSKGLYAWYSDYLQWFSNWRDAEFNRIIAFGEPVVVDASSLSFVRKTRDISRSICTEPTLNMFYQLGLGEIFASRLKSFFGVNIQKAPDGGYEQQAVNRKLALRGSLDNSLSTIDLESASDSVSCGLITHLVPPYISDVMRKIRTPWVRLPSRVDGNKVDANQIPLYMVSTMGNGFTFPLQTAIFSGIVIAAMRCNDLISRRETCRSDDPGSCWGVFGDDIICPTGPVTRDVLRLLRLCGFLVNHDKSYSDGPFRESCGSDYYQGVDVRGVYLKTLLTQNSRYVAINRLNDWSARSGIPLMRTVGLLRDSVRYLAVPYCESPDAGIRTPRPVNIGAYWRKQRYIYRCYVPVTHRLDIHEDRITFAKGSSNGAKRRCFNPPGLELSFIGGYVRNMQISLSLKQGEEPAYRTQCRVSPFWGPSIEQQASQPAVFWARWNTAVEANLGLDGVA